MTLEAILFGSISLVLYVYIGYPLMLFLLGRFRRKRNHTADITPFASVLIAAHNEEAVIAHKLDNTLSIDYPRENLEILVASDGSTDGTEEIVARYTPKGVGLLRLPRCGKMRVLENLAAQARGEILVFTDANTLIEPHALRALAAHFADPDVGGVCGNKKITPPTAESVSASSEGLYWKYDQILKTWESRIGSTIAGDGAIYAIRRSLFQPPAEPAQADDMAISMRIPIQGKRLIFESEAVAWEEPPGSAESEFWRKGRVANHVLRSLWELRRALNPMRTGLYAVQLWSHKLLRYFIPIPLVVAWIASFLLAGGSRFYSLLLAIQSAFYVLAFAGFILRNSSLGCKPLLNTPFYFCLAHTAALLGVLSALRGKRVVNWKHQRAAPSLRSDQKRSG